MELIERFKNVFQGLDRAHGVTKVTESISNGTKIKGKSFVKREYVTDELWQKHLEGEDSLTVKILVCGTYAKGSNPFIHQF